MDPDATDVVKPLGTDQHTPLASKPAAGSCPPAAASSSCGKRIYTDGGSAAYQLPLLGRIAAAALLLTYIGWIYVLGFLHIAALCGSQPALLACTALWASVFVPRMNTARLHWPAFIYSPVFKLLRLYFSYSVAFEQHLDPSKHYIFADFPHGAFPLSQLLALTTHRMAGWGGERMYGLAADSVFKVPLWRHVMSWLGIGPACSANLRRFLKWGCVGVTPGGIAEMYKLSDCEEHIYVRDRRGFARVAVEMGADIVPIFHFGASRLFSFGPKWLEQLGRRTRTSFGIIYGVWGLPLPRRTPLLMAVGRPVQVRKLPREHPEFEAAALEAHAAYIDALSELYDKYKAMYGWQERPLVMH